MFFRLVLKFVLHKVHVKSIVLGKPLRKLLYVTVVELSPHSSHSSTSLDTTFATGGGE